MGAAYGTSKSAIGIANLGMVEPTKIFKALIPIIMAGILGIYGLIVSVLITGHVPGAGPQEGFKLMFAGMCCGFSALASGLAIGVAGEASLKAYACCSDVFIAMVLIMIFAEAIGLFGLIVSIIMAGS